MGPSKPRYISNLVQSRSSRTRVGVRCGGGWDSETRVKRLRDQCVEGRDLRRRDLRVGHIAAIGILGAEMALEAFILKGLLV